jgi:hypothetical protein
MFSEYSQSLSMKFPKRPTRLTVIRLSKIAGILYALYVLFGLLGVPRIIKSVLQGSVAEALDRSVNLEKAAFNPFVLSTTLTGLRIENDTRASWSSLSVAKMNASWPEMRARIASVVVTNPQALAVA